MDSTQESHRDTLSTLMTVELSPPNSPPAPVVCITTYPLNEEDDDEPNGVDWERLDTMQDPAEMQSTEFLLARLEKENARLETDPRATHSLSGAKQPSLQYLKRLMHSALNDPQTLPHRESMLPAPPPMTQLDFWRALVSDYKRTAAKLPFLMSKKIRAGIPAPLRGIVWQSMSGARDTHLEGLYDTLSAEVSPYDRVIGRDLSRTFPGVEMFKEEGGQGQKFLGRVLRAYSLYDGQVGYCQGLGFLVGPLLMNMGERESFCVLVRIMECYDMRTMFTQNLSGLKLRLFQFSRLLETHVPSLAAHLSGLGIEPSMYASQWFLSLFGVTCPFATLMRLYDVIFAEGAPETIMRVAIALMQKNEESLLALDEFESVAQQLLGRGLWDVYGGNDDSLVNDACGLGGVVTRTSLADLERKFKEHECSSRSSSPSRKTSDLQAVASRFFGRLLSSPQSPTPNALSPQTNMSGPASPTKRTSSKLSVSTLASLESSSSSDTGNYTEPTIVSRTASMTGGDRNSKGLHRQIEDLVIALSSLQREHAQKEEEIEALHRHDEDIRALAIRVLESKGDTPPLPKEEKSPLVEELVSKIIKKTSSTCQKSSKTLTKELDRANEELSRERQSNRDFEKANREMMQEVSRLREQVGEIKLRYLSEQKDRQKAQQDLIALRVQHKHLQQETTNTDPPFGSDTIDRGLRELKLSRRSSTKARPASVYSNRSSQMGDESCTSCDSLKLELANAKTAEAIARQDAAEARNSYDKLRKQIGISGHSMSASMSSLSLSENGLTKAGRWFGAWAGQNPSTSINKT